MASPRRLPWELIERVIGHSGDHPQTLHNFSLTCRDLRPRALCLLVAEVHLENRDKIFDFCDLLKAKPHLKPLVRSISMNPDDFSPIPLLNILPNLTTLTFDRPQDLSASFLDPYVTVMHRSSLACFRHCGTHIQTLHLSGLYFSTYLDFARVLLSFTSLTHLVCEHVVINAEGDRAPLDIIKRRLSKQLRLLTICIHFLHYDFEYHDQIYDQPSVAALLLDSGLTQSTVETLAVRPYRSHGLPHPYDWSQLRSLVLNLEFTTKCIASAIVLLKDFPPSMLKDVMVKLEGINKELESMIEMLYSKDLPKQFEELEKALLGFSQPRIVHVIDHLREGRQLFWTQEVGKYFPVLLQRGAFVIEPRKVVSSGPGHDRAVRGLVVSSDGKWVASGSNDSTIILWDATNGAIARQWVAHSYSFVRSLAFSPDSLYLLSSDQDFKVKIWALLGGLGEVTAILEGHTKYVTRCAWSPRGDTFASASDDHTVRLWNAATFHPHHVLKHEDRARIQFIAFSPDGRWLISGSRASYHRYIQVWDVASGTLHNMFTSLWTGKPRNKITAAFDPTNTTCLAIAMASLAGREGCDEVELLDVETGRKKRIALPAVERATDLAFSPDGKLVVTGSVNGVVTIWDPYTGITLFSLRGHKKEVSKVCLSPNGKYAASASKDRTVRLWSTRNGSCMATFSEHNARVYHVAFSADGETLWSGDVRGTVIMRRMRDILPAD